MDLFNEQEIAEFREAFNQFDTDGDGFIDVVELQSVMNSLGQELETEEIEEIIVDASQGGNKLTFDVFLQIIRQTMTEIEDEERLWEAFKRMDTDNSGKIDARELKKMFKKSGNKVSKEDVKKMIEEADQDGDHEISFEEFKAIMLANNL